MFFPLLVCFCSVEYVLSNDNAEHRIQKRATVGCGVQADKYKPSLGRARIIGGGEAAQHSWPWSGRYAMKGADDTLACGVTLLRVKDGVEESDIVLSAAHCVTKNETRDSKPEPYPKDTYKVVFLGKHNRDITKEEGEQTIQVDDYKFPTDYIRYKNDVAIIKLKTPVKFNDYVRPICLPKPNDSPAGKTCVTVGWGVTTHEGTKGSNVLKQTTLALRADKDCAKPYTGMKDELFCAGDGKKDGTGRGDSGGAFVCQEKDGSWVQYGITSYGREGSPDKFANVQKYLTWILSTAKSMSSIK